MTSDAEWTEPTRSLPLRFGGYNARLAVSLCLLISSGVALQFASVYTLGLLAWGVAGSLAGWIIVPAKGWRRAAAIVPGVFGVASLLAGATSGAFVALTLGAWLLVRERRIVTFTLMSVPVATALVLGTLFPDYGWGVVVVSVLGAAVVACAWGARSLTAAARSRSRAGVQPRS